MSEWNVELEAAPESESAHVERRQAFRHRCNLQVSWCFFGKAEKGLWWTVVQDLSTTGIRLIGTRRLLGQKIHVVIAAAGGTLDFLVRILWTAAISEELFENGGAFVEVVPPAVTLKVVH